MTTAAVLGFTFFVLKLKFSQYLRIFWLILRTNFTPALRSCALTLVENIFLMPFRNTCSKKALCLSVLAPICGVAERKNRHLLDVTRSLLLAAFVPPQFWVEALSVVVFLINRLPSQVLEFDSPFFRLFHAHPDYTSLHPFGCVCFVHLPPLERNKLGAQSVCAFLGYSTSHKGFLCYDATSHRIRISRDVVFFYEQYFFPCSSPSSNDFVTLPNFSDVSHSIERFKPGKTYVRRHPALSLPATDPPAPAPAPLRRSCRVRRPPDRDEFGPISLTATLSGTSIPTCYSQAVKDGRWVKAMHDELHALQENFTWDIVPWPQGVKPIGCKWVYSVKLNSDGTLNCYKARLVALGNKQEYGVDYDETFALVAKMTSIRTILAIAASKG